MTSLSQIIQKSGFSKIFNLKQSPGYAQKAEKETERNKLKYIFWVFSMSGSMFLMSDLISFLFPDPETTLQRFLMLPLLLVGPGILAGIVNYREKQRKIDPNSMEQYQKDFKHNVFELTSTPQKIAEFFQALESEDSIRLRFDLPDLFQRITEQQQKIARSKRSGKIEECKFMIACNLEHVFQHYLTHELRQKGGCTSRVSTDIQESYTAALRNVDPTQNNDFLCATTRPHTRSMTSSRT